MRLEPVLPPWVLACVAAAIVLARIVSLRQLVTAKSGRPTLWRWSGLSLALVLLVVAAARPVLPDDDRQPARIADPAAPNVFVVLDRSPDMRVTDVPGGRSRMALARDDIAALLDRYSDGRIAVISFASGATLDWPLSADTWSLRAVAQSWEPYPSAPDAVRLSNAGAAGNMLRYQLIGARQQYPLARTLVYYLGAGTTEAAGPPRQFNLPAGAVDGGAVLGYGTDDGGPIPGTDVARSVVDERALRDVAGEIGVPYVARAGAQPLAATVPDVGTSPRSASDVPANPVGRTELYWAPAALAAVLILVELSLTVREFRRIRRRYEVVNP